MQNKSILLFEAWSISQIADTINAAVTGIGTDEVALLNAILQLADRQSVISLNQLMTGSNKYTYKTLDDVINGELGYFDTDILSKINYHLKKIRATDLLPAGEMKITSPEQIISEILPRVKQHEGVKSKMYYDSRGIPTIGVGFNLNRPDSTQKLQAVGADLQSIKTGKAVLTDDQISKLLIQDLTSAQRDAQILVQNWKALPDSVKGVLVEMTFNLGKKGLSEFKNFLGHINSRNFQNAAHEMLRSSWARQVGNRAVTLSNIVKQA